MKKSIRIVFAFILTFSLVFCTLFLNYLMRVAADQESTAKTLFDSIELKERNVVEYGSKINLLDYINIDDVSTEGTVDTNTVGKYFIKYTVSYNSPLGRKFSKEYTTEFIVEDTKSPIIEFEDSNVSRVYDVVDGELSLSDISKPGTYTIVQTDDLLTVRAMDKNRNISEESIEIQKQEKLSNDFSIFYFSDADASNVQELLNANYLVRYYGDIYHLSNKPFIDMFHSVVVGDIISLGGINYKCIDKKHGVIDNTGLHTDDGYDVIFDGLPQLITNDGEGNNRWILFLEPIN